MSVSFKFSVVMSLLWAASGFAAPPEWSASFPSGGQIGAGVTVTAAGKFSNWPVKVWVDRPGVAAQPAKDKGKLDVSVAPDAAPGVYWLRVYDEEGASSPRPFVVGTQKEAVEKEPNDDPAAPQALEDARVVHGKLQKSGDVDTYAVDVQQGQIVAASLLGNNTLGSPMDAIIQICSEDGFVLAQNDDERNLDPLLVLEAPKSGRYLVRVFAFPATPNSTVRFAGSSEYIYRLTITADGLVDHAFPMTLSPEQSTDVRLFGWGLSDEQSSVTVPQAAPDDRFVWASSPGAAGYVRLQAADASAVVATEECSPENPQHVTLPSVVTGRIEKPNDEDVFQFEAIKGKTLSLSVESSSLGFPLDPYMELKDASGKVVAKEDDIDRSQRDARISYKVPADGKYQLVVRDLYHHGGFRYVYKLKMEVAKGDFALAVSDDKFTLTSGKSLEIPVTIDRRNGFGESIEITAEGLPDGVTVKPVVSPPKGAEAKAVKLTLTSETGPWQGPIRVVGRSGEDTPTVRKATFTVSDGSLDQIWLTVKKKS